MSIAPCGPARERTPTWPASKILHLVWVKLFKNSSRITMPMPPAAAVLCDQYATQPEGIGNASALPGMLWLSVTMVKWCECSSCFNRCVFLFCCVTRAHMSPSAFHVAPLKSPEKGNCKFDVRSSLWSLLFLLCRVSSRVFVCVFVVLSLFCVITCCAVWVFALLLAVVLLIVVELFGCFPCVFCTCCVLVLGCVIVVSSLCVR